MQPEPQQREYALPREKPESPANRRLGYWLAGSIALILVAVLTATNGGIGTLLSADTADQVSTSQAADRTRMFAAAGPIVLQAVLPEQVPDAVASMGLDPAASRAMLAALAAIPEPAAAKPPLMQPLPTAIPKVSPNPSPMPAPVASSSRLALLTLWDTDAVDGDVVRVTSEGYSRDITLVKQPLTIAIPVPHTGVVNLSGVRDGGGGITVGVLSGTTQVALPVMSEGQVLGIPVVVH